MKNSAKTAKENKDTAIPIVGIGASAGGLKAFTQLLQHLPGDIRMAFVLVQHLDPKHVSILPELLAKATKMPVSEVKDGMLVEPNHVYVIPANVNMAIFHGVLNLMPRTEIRGLHLPIDFFLRSLAEDQSNKAIGVILSGTASDGALGLKEVKAAGGITFAQDPESAEYDGMPRSAVAAGVVDFILPPEKIANELARIGQHPFMARSMAKEEAKSLPEAKGDLMSKIFWLLRSTTGVDFTYYKQTTIKRRITRRMVVNKLDALEAYVRYLQEYPAEVMALYQDILITVTDFFRDRETFETLKKGVFPEIIKDKAPDLPIRVWVPGCSTGEEPYSIAMSLLESLEGMPKKPPVLIFATDINEIAIEKARAGIYPENITADVSPERLQRFFVKVEGGYQINTVIREMCIFAKHDVTKDPPFSRLDLVSFRNVLIYLNSTLQKKVIPALHYALQPKGYLVLGTSETVDGFIDLFEPVDKKHRIYSKKPAPSRLPVDFATRGYSPEYLEIEKRINMPREIILPKFDVQKEANHIVLEKYAPAGVIVDGNMEILQFRGHTGLFVEPAPGKASLNLLNMAREELALDLRTAINEAKKTNAPVNKEDIRIKHNGNYRDIAIEVIPIKAPSNESYYLVLFKENTAPADSELREAKPGKKKPAEERRSVEREIAKLKQELVATKEYLGSTIEEKDAAGEELRAANEEIQSSNEELQSINEELETSKEELQSSNEELTTVNDELQNRNRELMLLNDDLNNFNTSTDIPIIMLGNDLRIRRFTPTAERILNIIPSDVGRPIGDIRLKIDAPDLEQLILGVVGSLNMWQQEVQDNDGRWYSMQIRPYKTSDNRIAGAVISLLDIDETKRSLVQAEEARNYAQAIVETVREPLVVLDADLRVVSANQSFYRTFHVVKKETENILVYELGNRQWEIPKLRELLDGISSKSLRFEDVEVDHEFPDIGRRTMLFNARRIVRDAQGTDLILLAIEDITGRKRTEEESKKAKELSDALNNINADLISTLNIDKIMKRLVADAVKASGCESAAVVVREYDNWVIKFVYGFSDDLVGTALSDAKAKHLAMVARTKQMMVMNDAYNDERVDRKLMEEVGIRSFVAVPLLTRDSVIGMLTFHYRSAPVAFTGAQIDFASKLATTVSFALENTRLYVAERHIANTLQTALLAVPECIEEVEYGHFYRSATEAARVGGDFFDIFGLEGDRVGIVVGDVAGKGLEAATLTSLVRNTIRAYAYEQASPAVIMAKVNEAVVKGSCSGSFITVFFAIADTKSGVLRYCSAGHPPAMIKRTTAEVSLLEVNSPVIGAFNKLKFDEAEAVLKQGDVLVLYTDGVTEARCNGGFFEEEGLINLLKDMGPLSAGEVPEAIFNEVIACTKGEISDDIVVLALSLPSAGNAKS
ncbi:MAG: SpoIIE family protein phosphatase [Actinobacteria bacterium]|nr:SpoIIE family protein phosphatase [Actinomycetota bacterium]